MVIEQHLDRLRVVSAEFPPLPEEVGSTLNKRRSITLQTPGGPHQTADALAEAMAIFEAVMAGSWFWPDPDDIPGTEDQRRLQPEQIDKVVRHLGQRLLGEIVGLSTWQRTYLPYFHKLQLQAA